MEVKNDLPHHIAIIMDGNGRWANARGLPRGEGHRAGAESVREAVETCRQLGVGYLTLYAFSSENWNRPKKEIDSLMKLLERFLRDKLPEMLKQNVRLHAIGRLNMLPASCRKEIDQAIEKTRDNTGLNLILALSYGSREEITDAARRLAAKAVAGEIEPSDIDPSMIDNHLYTAGIPDPDLLIRTSGELRISNFLLWQISYSEIVISPKNWPDFRNADLRAAVDEYARRHRRFGTV
ncbi:isoprenyl transferase [Verrucomicrobiaceae bacterium 5K15]|uniref:Isoprenyl transferase n=1 Tax=Oceaniferula flava TaxID=2800421 RepID=A0AAE2V9K5_9BACT|nr:isoprenyl transferase [Oceaniferula flavus]MBK1855283.1 isoprenyl transferase [Oceaniferula flavus]MBM1136589.1 isoprenyl transferase [Oceaniferula flavus]